jgi:hypothetical protein
MLHGMQDNESDVRTDYGRIPILSVYTVKANNGNANENFEGRCRFLESLWDRRCGQNTHHSADSPLRNKAYSKAADTASGATKIENAKVNLTSLAICIGP